MRIPRPRGHSTRSGGITSFTGMAALLRLLLREKCQDGFTFRVLFYVDKFRLKA